MKIFILSVFMLVSLMTFVTICAKRICSLSCDIKNILPEIEYYVEQQNWQATKEKFNELEEVWRKNRISMFTSVSTIEIEAIDMSLRKMKLFIELEEKTDFLCQEAELKKLIEYLAFLEGVRC